MMLKIRVILKLLSHSDYYVAVKGKSFIHRAYNGLTTKDARLMAQDLLDMADAEDGLAAANRILQETK